jgi:hypothetical protein
MPNEYLGIIALDLRAAHHNFGNSCMRNEAGMNVDGSNPYIIKVDRPPYILSVAEGPGNHAPKSTRSTLKVEN